MKKLSYFLSQIITLGILISACAPTAPGENPQSNTPFPGDGSDDSSGKTHSNILRDSAASVPTADVETLVGANNAFALEMYRSLQGKSGNLIYSPYSISLALAMTFAGARGQTESQMADVLHFSLGQASTHPAFNALDQGLAKRSESPVEKLTPMQLNIANAVWAERTYPFQQAYLDTIALNYGAGIQLADFIKEYEPVRLEINRWVEQQTNGRIQDLLSQGSVNTDTRMLLVNAIYFKADWLTPFNPENTQQTPFHALDGSEAPVQMMSNEIHGVPYAMDDGYQALELPYVGGTAAMDIIVPDEGRFAEVESALTLEKFDEILAAMQSVSIKLGLPKFKYASEFSLTDRLSALGMEDAFNPGQADFSGMTGDRSLFISDVIHKAFVAVDEKGTEAAAATAVTMAMAVAPNSLVILTIDRPFIFIIRDTISGQILFMGRVVQISQ